MNFNFKNFSWQQWTGVALFVAVVVTLIVLHFVQPTVSYALTEAFTCCGFLVGLVSGFLVAKRKKSCQEE